MELNNYISNIEEIKGQAQELNHTERMVLLSLLRLTIKEIQEMPIRKKRQRKPVALDR